jgi:hypothetical protein
MLRTYVLIIYKVLLLLMLYVYLSRNSYIYLHITSRFFHKRSLVSYTTRNVWDVIVVDFAPRFFSASYWENLLRWNQDGCWKQGLGILGSGGR